jgi:hypothetical protein
MSSAKSGIVGKFGLFSCTDYESNYPIYIKLEEIKGFIPLFDENEKIKEIVLLKNINDDIKNGITVVMDDEFLSVVLNSI